MAVDVGAAGSGNARVLSDLGWFAVPVENGAEGAVSRGRARASCRSWQRAAVRRGWAMSVALDVLEHVVDDEGALRSSHFLRSGRDGWGVPRGH